MRGKRFPVAIVLMLSVLAGFAWWQRQPLLAWWYVRQLAQCEQGQREGWVKRVAELDDAAVAPLLDGLVSPTEPVGVNIEEALIELARRRQSARAILLMEPLRTRFDSFNGLGKAIALRVATTLLKQGDPADTLPAALAQAAGDLVKAGQAQDSLRPQVLHLASALLMRVPPGQWLNTGRALALDGLRDPEPRIRAAALQLCMVEALRADAEIVGRAVPLLHDPEAPVRRAALLALGNASEIVAEDDLLPLLHDPDVEIQQLCELALRGRGLQDRQLELARLISDQDPSARLRVLGNLQRGSEVDAALWLNRLSHDPAPAVRAAAVRAAAVLPQTGLQVRLQEITRQDESPTVRELAAYYLARMEPRR